MTNSAQRCHRWKIPTRLVKTTAKKLTAISEVDCHNPRFVDPGVGIELTESDVAKAIYDAFKEAGIPTVMAMDQ